MKRQRVSRACQKCRSLKAKCDGQQPSCSRCAGYGFTCTWQIPETQGGSAGRHKDNKKSKRLAVGTDDVEGIARIARSYEALIQSIHSKLDGADRTAVDIAVEHIRTQLPSGALPRRPSNVVATSGRRRQPSYQGNASDVEFLNTVRGFILAQDASDAVYESASQSYDQSDQSILVPTFERPIRFPKKKLALGYLDVYFSTIHIAYPYLHRPATTAHFSNILKGEVNESDEGPWLGLLSAIFAIGAYYMSFSCPRGDDAPSHSQYFEQSVYFSNQVTANCSITTVWILLAQCFYLLATCHIDRCWNILGLAVRMSQSLGLHVESLRGRSVEFPEPVERELRRRTWYSVYVLDRLLALQLGRPVAIHEEDFSVILPSRMEEPAADDTFARGGRSRSATHDVVEQTESKTSGLPRSEPSSIDYFLRVIRFSHILSQVIKELYRPTQVESPPEATLLTTSVLDMSLSRWKEDLPRHLRFDLGHTFERSMTFKRQRNMLAVKYHHLRLLIHRPFLCLPSLKRNNQPFMELLQRDRAQIDRAERICVSEAQATAHLLHNVRDERSLVHDFPWWQMIPCLICASSILLVAGAFLGDALDGLPQTFHEDAETCFKVFEALSINSEAASKATEMLKGLTRLRRCPKSSSTRLKEPDDPDQQMLSPASIFDRSDMNFPLGPELMADDDIWQWPSEISNTMEWSAQFLGVGHQSISPPAASHSEEAHNFVVANDR